ncbi:hypothetical protein ES695_20815 [Candidatus Atribacteria bacterium 1244-E10-H5-B2]|jgi:hypothetical protein|nr:MAG: hypothetical protein ES695_20815 [Candidatus Atribacteria bacterium 1244-E10-H5-B2]
MKNKYFLVVLFLILAIFLSGCGEGNKKQSVLTLSSEDILFISETDYYVTQCYATNKGENIWFGSVNMIVEDIDGGPLYARTSNAWLGIELKPGERDYLIAKIPQYIYLIENAPQGILVIVWNWGSQKVVKRVKIR